MAFYLALLWSWKDSTSMIRQVMIYHMEFWGKAGGNQLGMDITDGTIALLLG